MNYKLIKQIVNNSFPFDIIIEKEKYEESVTRTFEGFIIHSESYDIIVDFSLSVNFTIDPETCVNPYYEFVNSSSFVIDSFVICNKETNEEFFLSGDLKNFAEKEIIKLLTKHL